MNHFPYDTFYRQKEITSEQRMFRQSHPRGFLFMMLG